jgi:hypothetical protein
MFPERSRGRLFRRLLRSVGFKGCVNRSWVAVHENESFGGFQLLRTRNGPRVGDGLFGCSHDDSKSYSGLLDKLSDFIITNEYFYFVHLIDLELCNFSYHFSPGRHSEFCKARPNVCGCELASRSLRLISSNSGKMLVSHP